ncbi:hypothetical protein T484DRAFT_1818756 [Baffinella frigidus]|nr:hypothetical protein T484DRAFT_1818756 [Cryptophyta sp. CCMP2293]
MTFEDLVAQIRPIMGDYYMYWGSQTFPPCYQGVQWMIPTTTLKVSSGVIGAFKGKQGENIRPSFALGSRPLTKWRAEGATENPYPNVYPSAHQVARRVGNRPLTKWRAEAPDHWTYRGPRGEDW